MEPPGFTPGGDAHRSTTRSARLGRAAAERTGAQSEWYVVVSGARAAGHFICERRRAGTGAAAAGGATGTAAEEADLLRDDLRHVALVAVLVVVAVGADRALDVDLPPFRKILAAVLALLPPHDDVVPLGALLLVPFGVVPRLAGRE